MPGCAHSSRVWLHQDARLPQRKVSVRLICLSLYVCMHACNVPKKKGRKRIKSALFIWWDFKDAQKRAVAPTSPSPVSIPSSSATGRCGPLWSCSLWAPSVTLAFHLYKDRHDSLAHSCSQVSFWNVFCHFLALFFSWSKDTVIRRHHVDLLCFVLSGMMGASQSARLKQGAAQYKVNGHATTF